MEPILLKPPDVLPRAEPLLLPAADKSQVPNETADRLNDSSVVGVALRGDDLAEPSQSDTVVPSEASAGDEVITLPPRRSLRQSLTAAIVTASTCTFGAISLIGGLAILASYPIVQFLSLGYLLEAAGRIGRSGRFRDAFPGVRFASRIGGAVLGAWIVVLPWRFARLAADDARLIDPTSTATNVLDRLVVALFVLTPIHVLLAISRGGKLRYFFSPFNVIWLVRRILRGGYSREMRDSVVQRFRQLRLWHYFSLGLRGYAAAGVWLVIPTTFYVLGRSDARGVFAFLGGLLLAAVVLYVPFLQVQFAAENSWRAMFRVKQVRERFRRAPIAFLIAFVFTLLLVLPLYLLKVEVVPRDAMWLPALVFIVTIFPLKVLTGWAYGRAGRRENQAHWFIRFTCRALMVPVALFYALIVFFTQYTGWHGIQSIYEHHAFLLPVPF